MSRDEMIKALTQEIEYLKGLIELTEYENQALILQNQDLNRIIEGLKECRMN